jgi:hypothetical protein
MVVAIVHMRGEADFEQAEDDFVWTLHVTRDAVVAQNSANHLSALYEAVVSVVFSTNIEGFAEVLEWCHWHFFERKVSPEAAVDRLVKKARHHLAVRSSLQQIDGIEKHL